MEEIKLNKPSMDDAVKRMDDLAAITKNYSSNIAFEKSKGDTVEALLHLSEELASIRDAFVATCIATSEALQFTIDSFVETDNTIGDYFEGKEGN